MIKAISIGVVGLAACGLTLASCYGDPDIFGGGSGTATGSGSASGTSTTGTGTPTGGGGGGLTSSTGGAAGAGGSSTGTGGTGGTSTGTGPPCEHDVCLVGPPLKTGCSPCVSTVCNADAGCCSGNDAFWGYRCVELADELCAATCGAGKETCDEQYGVTPTYHLCEQGAATCLFGFSNLLTSCRTVCRGLGGVCLGTYDNVDNTYCDFDSWLTCDAFGEEYNVCVCSRGCGNGPSCDFGQSCVDGHCQ